MTLIGSQDTGLGNVDTAGQDDDGGGVGTIQEITSSDGSIDVSDPTGPIVDLTGAGTIKQIQSSDGSIDVTDPNGPIVDVVVADKTPGVVAKFTGMIVSAEGDSFSYMADPGQQQALAEGVIELQPQLYPTSARVIARIRAVATNGNGATAYTATLYKNGVVTAQTVTVPAAATVGEGFLDSAHPITFLDGDRFDVRLDKAESADDAALVSVTLEGPGGNSPAPFVGVTWLEQQMGHAQSMVPELNSPVWFDDLAWDHGQSIQSNVILTTYYEFANGSTTQVQGEDAGVVLCDPTGPAADPTNLSFVFSAAPAWNLASKSWCICSRVQPQGSPSSGGAQRVLCGSVESDFTFFAMLCELGGEFLLQFNNNATPVGVAGGVVDFDNPHDYSIIFDKAAGTITAYQDRVPIPGLPVVTDLSGLPIDMSGQTSVGAGAFGQSSTPILIDKVAFIVPSF